MGWRRGHKPAHGGDNGHAQTSVWQIDYDGRRMQQGTEHPPQKPVELFAIRMRKHTRGDVVFEPFSGSGSQLIAAERGGRSCYALEIEARFVDVAVERWQRFSGKTAERLR